MLFKSVGSCKPSGARSLTKGFVKNERSTQLHCPSHISDITIQNCMNRIPRLPKPPAPASEIENSTIWHYRTYLNLLFISLILDLLGFLLVMSIVVIGAYFHILGMPAITMLSYNYTFFSLAAGFILKLCGIAGKPRRGTVSFLAALCLILGIGLVFDTMSLYTISNSSIYICYKIKDGDGMNMKDFSGVCKVLSIVHLGIKSSVFLLVFIAGTINYVGYCKRVELILQRSYEQKV